jgi:deoxyuridine 5'-triphosphate nucleotidohydrolase
MISEHDIMYMVASGWGGKCAPQRMSTGDIGYDLSAAEGMRFNRGDVKVIPLGVAFEMPDHIYGELTHRSSLAFKKDMICSFGIIDASFNGKEVKAKIFNLSDSYQQINKGDRIVQIIFKERVNTVLHETGWISSVGSKEGFGSSGIK